MIEQKPPTHILSIRIPLSLGVAEPVHFDAVQDAVTLALSISRAAYFDAICNDIMVTLHDFTVTRKDAV